MFKKGDKVYIDKNVLKNNLERDKSSDSIDAYTKAADEINTNGSMIFSIDDTDITIEGHDKIFYADELISKKQMDFKKELAKVLKETTDKE